MSLRSLAFVGALGAAIVPAVVIASQLQNMDGAHALGWGETMARAIARAAPSVVADAAFVGFTTPVLFAGALAYVAPSKDERVVFALALFMCVAGWGAYTWLSSVLAEDLARDALMSLLDQGKGLKETEKSFDYVANFSIAARIVYLALGAALAGVKLRPSKGAAAAALILVGVVATAQDARAGSISVLGKATDFDVAVSLREEAGADPVALPLADGAFVYSFDASIFTEGAYAQKTLIVEWSPKAADVPAVGVAAFTVEIPLLLRKWRVDDRRRIDARPFMGVGQEALHAYEWMRDPAKRWTRFLASLQQSEHYARRLHPESGLAGRALNTAMSAFSDLSGGGWVLAPPDLRDRLSQSFKGVDTNRFLSLSEALDHAESRIWLDLNTIEGDLQGESCESVKKTFDFLDERRAGNERAYRLQVGSMTDLLDRKRKAALDACAAPPAR